MQHRIPESSQFTTLATLLHSEQIPFIGDLSLVDQDEAVLSAGFLAVDSRLPGWLCVGVCRNQQFQLATSYFSAGGVDSLALGQLTAQSKLIRMRVVHLWKKGKADRNMSIFSEASPHALALLDCYLDDEQCRLN